MRTFKKVFLNTASGRSRKRKEKEGKNIETI